MFAFDGMLVPAAKKVKIKIPKNLEKYDKEEYPHWFVFCFWQLGRAMPYADVHFDNAEIIASLSDKEIKEVTLNDLQNKGCQ